jgi:hypothetical protein
MPALQDIVPNKQQAVRLVLAGVVAVILWEITTRLVFPALFDVKLQPAILILKLFGLGKEYKSHAFALHLLTGAVFYPIGFYILVRAVFSAGAFFDGILFGVATWAFGLGVIAPIAGIPAFVNFNKGAWLSLVGHLVYGITLALVFRHRKHSRK